MKLKFSKMHGLGNDFMVIDGISQSISLTASQISLWADRHFGIGFDQLLLVEKAQGNVALFRYRIFNADGSEVAQCGNGARCFARFVREKGLTDQTIIPVETSAGLLQLKMISKTQVEVNMGIPDFEPRNIPVDSNHRQASYQLVINDQTIKFSALSIGNPHIVIMVENVDSAAVESIGPALESHPFFPQKVNVGFIQIMNRNSFKLRVYERGVGETKACGSGACAAMAAAHQLDLIDSSATAFLTGGQLQLDWQGEGKPVMMTGNTAQVYEGKISI